MSDSPVTVAYCVRCAHTGGVIVLDDRTWCARCQEWTTLTLQQVAGVRVDHEAAQHRLRTIDEFILQPLRVPRGWNIDYNQFYQLDPSDDAHWHTDHSLLLAQHAERDRIIDLDWRFRYRDDDSDAGESAYRLVLRSGHFAGPLSELRTPDRISVVAAVERLMDQVSRGRS